MSTQTVTQNDAIVAVYNTHTQAEDAIKQLERAGFDLKQLSIVGRDYHTEDHVVGYYNAGQRMKYWGKLGAFWGGIWGLLFGAAFFWVPGVGPLIVAGPLAAAIVGALENAAVLGGVSALAAGLVSLGIPKDSVLQYETDLRAGKYVLIVHGTPADVLHAKDIVDATTTERLDHHHAI
ncbi:MAG: general stress protein [Planctomycetales bacterium]|nr:general stress protein [Planctomycetales bacterium]